MGKEQSVMPIIKSEISDLKGSALMNKKVEELLETNERAIHENEFDTETVSEMDNRNCGAVDNDQEGNNACLEAIKSLDAKYREIIGAYWGKIDENITRLMEKNDMLISQMSQLIDIMNDLGSKMGRPIKPDKDYISKAESSCQTADKVIEEGDSDGNSEYFANGDSSNHEDNRENLYSSSRSSSKMKIRQYHQKARKIQVDFVPKEWQKKGIIIEICTYKWSNPINKWYVNVKGVFKARPDKRFTLPIEVVAKHYYKDLYNTVVEWKSLPNNTKFINLVNKYPGILSMLNISEDNSSDE